MDTGLLETLITLGYDVRFTTVKTVVDGKDVKLIRVAIDDFVGDGLTPTAAFTAARAAMLDKLQRRHDKDVTVIAALSGVSGPS